MIKVVIDTDAGFDDLLAILYVLADRNFSLQGITVVGGLCTDPQIGGSVIRYLLEKAGRPDVPVYIGVAQPQPGGHPPPPSWTNQITTLGWGPPQAGPLPGAVQYLQNFLHANQTGNVLMAIGPLSNIAQALPSTPPRVTLPILAMGAAFGNPPKGNIPDAPQSEFNFYVDPVAAQTVFSDLRFRRKLLPLNATDAVPITRAFIDAFLSLPASRPVVDLAQQVFKGILTQNGAMVDAGQYCAWDPLLPAIMDGVKVTAKIVGQVAVDPMGMTTHPWRGNVGSTDIYMAVNPDQFAPAYQGVLVNGTPPGGVAAELN